MGQAVFSCTQCGKKYKHKKDMKQHVAVVHKSVRHDCKHCGKSYTRITPFIRHLREIHGRKQNKRPVEPFTLKRCIWCLLMKELLPGKHFCRSCSSMGVECITCHKPKPEHYFTPDSKSCNTCLNRGNRGAGQSALNGAIQEREFIPEQRLDPTLVFQEVEEAMKDELQSRVLEKKGIKYFLRIEISFTRMNSAMEQVETTTSFQSQILTVFSEDQIVSSLAISFQDLYSQIENFNREGSGWVIEEIFLISIHSVVHKPLASRQYKRKTKQMKT